MPNVNHALQALKKKVQEHQVNSVALSHLATGVGGPEWKKASPWLQQALKDLNSCVRLRSVQKGMTAQEA